MNRQLKFRAWSKEDSRMITAKNCQIDFHGCMTSNAGYDVSEDYILMQYTGLSDKNGIECYQGDLSIINGELCMVNFCTFFTGGWDFKSFKIGSHPFSEICNSFNGLGCTQFEIIGNIHENPELLK